MAERTSGAALPAQSFYAQARTRDVVEQADALPLWQQDYTQLGTGRFQGSVDSMATPSLQVFKEAMNRAVDEQAQAPQNTYVIGVPLLMQGDAYWNNMHMPCDALLTLDVGSTLSFRTADVSEIAAVAVRASDLEAYAELVEELDWRQLFRSRAAVEPLPLAQAEKLRLLFDEALTHASAYCSLATDCGPSGHTAFELDVFALCVNAMLSTGEQRTALRQNCKVHRYLVDRVRDCVLAQPEQPPSIGQLCLQLKVSRRTLNQAFLHALGASPLTYVRNLRLIRVRRELQQAPQSTCIADIAARWGFWHMSLFSRYYRDLFNELPSQTLRRHSGCAGNVVEDAGTPVLPS